MRALPLLFSVFLGACLPASMFGYTDPTDGGTDLGDGGTASSGSGSSSGAEGSSTSGITSSSSGGASATSQAPWSGTGGIRVDLSWDRGPTDLDLHLVKADDSGSFALSTPADCYSRTCLPSHVGPLWDPAAGPHLGGNPTLARDNVTTGPETITVPAPVPGQYLVAVRAANDARAYDVTPTLIITLADTPFTAGPVVLDPGVTWEVGVITWAAGAAPRWQPRPAP